MFSLFFIRRPIFASVISIIMVVVGLVALISLPVSRYPDIAPPTIQITAFYPGADARTIAETVATPIEQEVNGVEGMIYMSSVASNDGRMTLTVTFSPGTDLDIANVLVQNRVAVAEARLPEEVKRQGVTVKKMSSDVIMYISLVSPEETYDADYLSNYTYQRLTDELARVNGVGSVSVYGTGQFSMRVWLNPDKLQAYDLVASDVVNAIRQQNMQVAGGQIGAEPAPSDTAKTLTVNVRGRLSQVAEFENIIVKIGEDGSFLRVRDVAEVELGSDSYSFRSQQNGKPSATIAVYQIPGTNILDVANGVKKTMADLATSFPEDLDYTIIYDNTDVVKASIKGVVGTLISALILVVLTVYLFLQNFRATIIPAITIPVALIATFAALAALGFSLNQLTLFGLVLVIGIVVDDAIVVVENTTRWIEEGMESRAAAEKAMLEVSGPVIATTLVLLAVFVPTIFIPGITGTLFKQFAVTISIATIFSSVNALTLSPALSGLLLRKQKKEPRGFFKIFNTTLDKSTSGYLGIVKFMIRKVAIFVILLLAVAGVSIWGLGSLPTGFVPQEDEGYCLVNMQLPDGASLQRTQEAVDEINSLLGSIPGVNDYIAVSGYSIVDAAVATNTAMFVVTFTPWGERKSDEVSQAAIIQNINQRLATQFDKGLAFAFPIPSLPGVGASGGFTFMLQDRGGVGLANLQNVASEIITDGNGQTGLTGLKMTFRSSVPQLLVDIDREQVMRARIPLESVFEALQINLGSAYVNDFTEFGRIYKVYAQAAGEFRNQPEVIRDLKVKNRMGEMVSMGAIADVREDYGPQTVNRFNLYPSVKILGNAAPGFSSGEAMEIMEQMAEQKLPASMGFSWSELSYQEKLASGGTSAIFVFAIFMVFLFLAAQYESWSLPISVIMAVPTAILGAVIAVSMRGYDNNVYTQIGVVLLIGLSTKSAILIVEFAKELHDKGKSVFDAAIEATRLRFRAVLMTAFSFILGVIPLLVASGAGAESQRVIGTSVFGGMILTTVVSLASVPVLYYAVQSFTDKLNKRKSEVSKNQD